MEEGFKNEIRIVNAYNNKTFKELNNFQKEFINSLFGLVPDNRIIYASRCERHSKPDILISINKRVRYISVKSGRCNSIHSEKLKDFIMFLRENNISIETQKIILLFYYGDDTLNGTGKVRYLYNDVMKRYGTLVAKANSELNNIELLKKALDRFLFTGTEKRRMTCDYIYYGNENKADYISKEKIEQFVIKKDYNHIKSLHIGPMVIQPYIRDVNHKSIHPYKRQIIQVRWHYLLSDIKYINRT